MFLVEPITSSFLDLISKQARGNAAVSAFLLLLKSEHRLLYSTEEIQMMNVTAATIYLVLNP